MGNTKHFAKRKKIPEMLTREEYDIAQAGGDPKGLMLTNKNSFDDMGTNIQLY